MTEHLTKEEMLRYLDGELSKSSKARTAEHLESCWTCRAELDHLEADIALILDAQNQIFVPSLPPPPKPWVGIEANLKNRERRLRGSSFKVFEKEVSVPIFRTSAPLITAALVAVLIVALIWWPVRPISAEEVLHRVEVADGNRLQVPPHQVLRQQVQIKKRARHSSVAQAANLEAWKSDQSTYWQGGQEAIGSELLHLYKSLGIASTLPLSPQAVKAWTHLAGSVPTAFKESAESIKIQVAAKDAESSHGLEEVSVHVLSQDWHVDEMQLKFVDSVYDIAEENLSIVDRRDVPSDVMAFLAPPSPKPIKMASVPHLPRVIVPSPSPPLPNLDDVELGVRYDLHRIGADLGESIEVTTQKSGPVVVNAWGISPERKSQLLVMLQNRPEVRLDLQAPGDSGAISNPSSTHVVIIPQEGTPKQISDDQLSKFFGSTETEENYTRTVVQISTDILSHFYALRTLATRWPPEKDVQLDGDSKARLTAMVEDHGRRVRDDLIELKAELGPLLNNFGYEIQSGASTGVITPWQPTSLSGLDAAKWLDHVLRSLLTTSESPLSLNAALPAIQRGLLDLDRSAHELP
jgi:hypothetical protein